MVESGWKKRDGKTLYTVTIPDNTTALLHLPDGSSHDLTAGAHTYMI